MAINLELDSRPGSSGISKLYHTLCLKRWDAMVAGIVIALLSVLIVAWMRPWGIVGGIRNLGDWLIFSGGGLGQAPPNSLTYSGSVIVIGVLTGAFISACIGNDFAFRIPPLYEAMKGIVGGLFMGIGSVFAGGCNVGAMYAALGNLSAHGLTMWLGIVIGVLIGLKWLYWEIEHITWGNEGASTTQLPRIVKVILAIVALMLMLGAFIGYRLHEDEYIARLGGVILIACAIGYTMQRGHWCMVQGFREPHMTGNATIAKSMAVSIFIYALGVSMLKAGGITPESVYVRGTFGWGSLVGGMILGFGAMLAGGCGSGSIWRAAEGQVKLWLTVIFFALSNAMLTQLFRRHDFEGMTAWREYSTTDAGILGRFVYLPDHFSYPSTVLLIGSLMALWYFIVRWNEKSKRLVIGG